jgi:hypothetical protein
MLSFIQSFRIALVVFTFCGKLEYLKVICEPINPSWAATIARPENGVFNRRGD